MVPTRSLTMSYGKIVGFYEWQRRNGKLQAANNALKITEVGSYVNKNTNEGPECIEPVAA